MKLKNYNIKLIIFSAIIYSIFSPINSQELDKEYNQLDSILSWEDSKGVSSYQLQIQDEKGSLIVNQKMKSTQYDLKEFNIGKYKHRVGVYNKFGKLVGFTRWVPFTITRVETPIVINKSSQEVYKNEEYKEVLVKGENFLEISKISLKHEKLGDVVFVNDFKFVSEKELKFKIKAEDLDLGVYSLVVENPRKKKTIVEGYLKVLEPKDVAIVPPEKSEPEVPSKKEESNIPEKSEEPPSKTEPDKKVTSTYPYWKEGLYSALLPGLGQFAKDQKLKGSILGILFLSSVAAYNVQYARFSSDKDKYNQTVYGGIILPYFFPNDEKVILFNISRNQDKYNDGLNSAGRVGTAGKVVGAIYALTILDALFWKKKESLQTELYSDKFYFFTDFYNNTVRVPGGTSIQTNYTFGFKIHF
ncbi:MAG: hypothetical protein KDK36_08560 [Leptospiraceae bacterium]|nr:hypothetical protein [Leptospiraceae bacterium]